MDAVRLNLSNGKYLIYQITERRLIQVKVKFFKININNRVLLS